MGQLPGGDPRGQLVDPGLPLLGRDATGRARGVVELRLSARQAHLRLVEDQSGFVPAGGRLPDQLLGDPGRHRPRGSGVLRRPAHEAGVTRDQPRGELAADVGQSLVHEQLVVVVRLLVGPSGRPPFGAPLLDDPAELGKPSRRLRLTRDRLEHDLGRRHAGCRTAAQPRALRGPRPAPQGSRGRAPVLPRGGVQLLRACPLPVEQTDDPQPARPRPPQGAPAPRPWSGSAAAVLASACQPAPSGAPGRATRQGPAATTCGPQDRHLRRRRRRRAPRAVARGSPGAPAPARRRRSSWSARSSSASARHASSSARCRSRWRPPRASASAVRAPSVGGVGLPRLPRPPNGRAAARCSVELRQPRESLLDREHAELRVLIGPQPGGLTGGRHPGAQLGVGALQRAVRLLRTGLQRLGDGPEELGAEQLAQDLAPLVVPGAQERRELALGQEHHLAELLTGQPQELADDRADLVLGVRAALPAAGPQALEVDAGLLLGDTRRPASWAGRTPASG